MKISKLFFIAIVLLGFTACSSDDDSPNVELNSEGVVGSYNLVFLQSTFEESQTASNGSNVVIETETCTGDTFTDAVIVFNSNGSYVITGSYRESCTVVIQGESTTESQISSVDDSGPFSVDTENRTITLDGIVYDVTLFNGINLNLIFNEVDDFNGDIETSTGELRFVKQG